MTKTENITAKAIAFCMYTFATVLVVGCSRNSNQMTVRLYAAASSQEAVESICRKFEELHKIQVITSFAGTSTLANQVLNGAEVDVFLSANTDWIEKLEQEALASEIHHVADNQLVVIAPSRLSQNSPARQIKSLDDLQSNSIQRIAIADPDSVPAGIYARKALEASGIWESIESKCVLSSHVRQTVAHVEIGAADVGIVYASDAKICKSAETVIAIPIRLTGSINYKIALVKNDFEATPMALKLVEYICGTDAQQVFARYGFIVDGEDD